MPGRFEEISRALECDRSRCDCQKRTRSHLTHCVAHDDQIPSLSITAQPDGGTLVNCKAGCANEEVIEALTERGLWAAKPTAERSEFSHRRNQARREERKEKRQGAKKARPDAIDTRRAPDFNWYFEDAAGKKWARKARWNGDGGAKTFRLQAHDQRTWTLGDLGIEDLPLYGTELLAKHTGPVYITEGEKCADAVRAEPGHPLALCPAGGASQRQFGTALFPLAGRLVYTLADNDPEGDDFMHAIEEELRLLDCDVTRLHLPVMPGQDIADYLADDHTLLDLMEQQYLDPLIEPITDGIRIHVPADTPGRRHVYTFAGIEQRRGALGCELSVQVIGQGARKHTHRQRINLLSGSAVRELKSTLRGIWPTPPKTPNEPFDLTVSTACDLVFDWARNRTPVVDMTSIEHPGPIEWRIQDFLQEGQPHIIFADGNTGKSMLAIHLAAAIAYGVPAFDEFYCRPGPVLYVDYETEGDGGKSWRRRCARVLEGLELDPEDDRILYWAPDGVPLAEQAEAMRRYCDRKGIALVIIDSAIPALGGSPIETEPVQQMFRAISRLRTTTLIISHVSQEDAKGGKGAKVSPYGNRFWFNLPRALYRLDVRPETENQDLRALALFPTKSNDWAKMGPIYIDQGFDGSQLGPITFRATTANWTVSEERKARGQTWLARIVEALEVKGGQTVADLADLLEGEDDTIRRTASRGEGRGLLYRQLGTEGEADQWFAGTG